MKLSGLSKIALILLMSSTVYAEIPATNSAPAVQTQKKEEETPEQKEANETALQRGARNAGDVVLGAFLVGAFVGLLIAAILIESGKKAASMVVPNNSPDKSDEQQDEQQSKDSVKTSNKTAKQ